MKVARAKVEEEFETFFFSAEKAPARLTGSEPGATYEAEMKYDELGLHVTSPDQNGGVTLYPPGRVLWLEYQKKGRKGGR